MRLGLTLSLVSSFQIFQQSVINELHDVDKKSIVFSIASAAFPLGSFFDLTALGMAFPSHSLSGIVNFEKRDKSQFKLRKALYDYDYVKIP
ncbi:unnamed protein product [Strongylus vulgaris]|uniref:Uncharacterized protein n=1 Tax=Strongylus vulgaris TaxID=40348 RepID=A0A3P7J0K8_STRVU|nr:unnamed protein product [Strongylus vulgaris]